MLGFRVSIGLLHLDLIDSCKMKPCYEGMKEIRVDIDKIWSENVRF